MKESKNLMSSRDAVVCAVLAVVGIAVVYFFAGRRHSTEPVFPAPLIDKMTAEISSDRKWVEVSGRGTSAKYTTEEDPDSRVSPDKKMVIHAVQESGLGIALLKVRVKDVVPIYLLELSPQQLANGAGLARVVWSPDSKFVALQYYRSFSGTVKDPEVEPNNEILVVGILSGERVSLSKEMRSAIEAFVPNLDKYSAAMQTLQVCTYSPVWDNGFVQFTWDLAGPTPPGVSRKPSYTASFRPFSVMGKTALDFDYPKLNGKVDRLFTAGSAGGEAVIKTGTGARR